MPEPTLEQIEHDLRIVRRGLKDAGAPQSVLNSIKTRALKTGRRQTGPHKGNRANRWDVSTDDRQYGSEPDCKMILLKLYAEMLEFKNAPTVDEATKQTLEKYLGHQIEHGTYRDALTKERLDFARLVAESKDPQHGKSEFHLGHENPKAFPRHTPENVHWRGARSNLHPGRLNAP